MSLFCSQVLSIHNLQCHAGIFTRMLLNQRLVDAVSELIGSPNVLLHHTKAHIKPPGIGAPFPTHQVNYLISTLNNGNEKSRLTLSFDKCERL